MEVNEPPKTVAKASNAKMQEPAAQLKKPEEKKNPFTEDIDEDIVEEIIED